VLAIETSNPSAPEPGSTSGPGVALASCMPGAAPTLLAVERVEHGSAHDDALMPAVERVFRRAGVRPAELALVAVSTGPGGYTALRIAVTTARFVALACGARCVGVPSAHVAAAGVPRGSPFAVGLASKDATCFVQVFDAQGLSAGAGRLIDASGVEGLGVGRLVADRFLPEPVRARAVSLGMDLLPIDLRCEHLVAIHSRYTPMQPDALHPLYPREPEAVVKWRMRHGGRG
jgi:tRNA threonylcarbamoyl adenosine modification protein YeaZ